MIEDHHHLYEDILKKKGHLKSVWDKYQTIQRRNLEQEAAISKKDHEIGDLEKWLQSAKKETTEAETNLAGQKEKLEHEKAQTAEIEAKMQEVQAKVQEMEERK